VSALHFCLLLFFHQFSFWEDENNVSTRSDQTGDVKSNHKTISVSPRAERQAASLNSFVSSLSLKEESRELIKADYCGILGCLLAGFWRMRQ
jgi:hypothetical protein